MSKTSNCIKLLRILKTHLRVRKSELASMLDTNPRNITEYIKELESSGYIIDTFTGKYGGYELRCDVFFPNLRLNKEEFNALMQGIEYLRARNDFAFKKEFNSAISKILTDNQKLDYKEVTIINRFPLKMSINEIENRLKFIQDAIKTKHQIKIIYSSLDNKSKEHILSPLKIFMFNNAWFVLALDKDKDKILYFKLNRMENIELLDQKFRIPLYYKESDYLDEFGMKNNGKWYKIKLKITGNYATLVQERIYGKNQSLEIVDKDTTILTCEMQNEENILGFVLGFGKNCEFLEPIWLKDKVLETINEISDKYIVKS